MKHPETGQEFIFTTGSRGGVGAIGRLSTKYAWQRHKQSDKLPIIEIGSDSYKHPQYGDVPFPVFQLVRWESEDALIAGETGADLDTELDDVVPF